MMGKISLLILLVFTLPVFPQSQIKVISSDRNSIVIEYTPVYRDTSSRVIDNQKYLAFPLQSGFVPDPMKWGEPQIPERILNVGVPSEYGNTIQILSSEFKEVSGKIVPKPRMVKDGEVDGSVVEVGPDYYNYKAPEDIVSFGEFGLMRSVPTQSVVLSPIIFNPQSNSIKLYTKIIFRINFSHSQIISSKPADDIISGALVNFNTAKFWVAKKESNRLEKKIINSVLAQGKWYRFEASQDGIYKITREMLPSYGIDPATVDPSTIKIYNNGGKMLPENINSPRPEDLQENAIYVATQSDGTVDYILFYAHGADFWGYDTSYNIVKRFHHPYSNQNYYWITSGGTAGKRMEIEPSLKVTSPYVQNSSAAYADWEEDKINIGKSGRQYMGDDFSESTLSRTYTTKLDGRLDSQPVKYTIRFIDASAEAIGLKIDENSTTLFNSNIYGYGSADYTAGTARTINASFSGTIPDNRSLLKFQFTPTAVTSQGYLDYFEIRYRKQLSATDDNLLFFSDDTAGVIQYNLSGFSTSNIRVFDVTDYSNAKLISNPVMLSGGEYRFQKDQSGGGLSKFVAVGSDKFLTPANPVEESNSNIHGISQGAKFVIITAKPFDEAAQRLKTYKETQAPEKISTIVVNVKDIFNEFSCGLEDPTAIRDFMKYAYDNWQVKPEYCLLLGKGTYDYKDVEGYHTNFVPVWETPESLDLLRSYLTDDYFFRVSGPDFMIDIAYGRLPVTTLDEANTAVDKIIQYETGSVQGAWRNLITLVADDAWAGTKYDGTEHTAASEYLANYVIPSSFDLHKIYLAAYPVELTSNGRRIPSVNKAIVDAINNGTLIMNYIGHGSPELWAHEEVFVKSTTIPQLHNSDLMFLTAATCDFGYYDIPNFQSAAEELVLMKDAGCIAALTASRLVISTSNHTLNYEYFKHLLAEKIDSTGLSEPIGLAAFLTKQTLYGENDQKYEILGDPTVRLLMPRYNAAIDSIDGQKLTSRVQIKALSNVRIAGDIRNENNSVWSDYNGQGILTMFDSERQVPLPALGNYKMTVQGGIIFRGRISVTNGRFSTDFVVPKDISYENKNGKIILYFYNNNSDGIGYTNNIIVGGTDSTAVNDKQGPDMNIYFDNTGSESGELVNPNSTLIVKLSDNSGLNTTGTGVGHKLEGILNDNLSDPIDFTNYFTSDLNSGGKSGDINYKFNDLAPGQYKLSVKAWDVFNNFSEKTTYFSVVDGSGLTVKDVYNYPDPFTNSTTFTFQQNLDKPIDVRIKVYTVAGRLIREIKKENLLDKFVKIYWNGRDQDGNEIANGTYLYKVIVQSVDGQYSKSVLGKLAVIR